MHFIKADPACGREDEGVKPRKWVTRTTSCSRRLALESASVFWAKRSRRGDDDADYMRLRDAGGGPEGGGQQRRVHPAGLSAKKREKGAAGNCACRHSPE